jgi:hypothetical protein
VAEVPIRNVPRAAGESHYGLSRTFNVLLDILTIRFLTRYMTRLMHLFGRLGLMATTLGSVILGYLAIYKFTGHHLMFQHGPLMIAGVLALLAGLVMFSTGLLSEILIRTYFESHGRPIYAVHGSSAARRAHPSALERRSRCDRPPTPGTEPRPASAVSHVSRTTACCACQEIASRASGMTS